MKLPELIDRLQRMRTHLTTQGIDSENTDVVLWGCTACVDPETGDDMPRVANVDYDKFEDDTPHVVIIEKDGDP